MKKKKISYISVWRCGFSSAKLSHQKSKPVMLLSQVKLAGNRLLGTDMSFFFNVTLFMRICVEICHKSTTLLLPLNL